MKQYRVVGSLSSREALLHVVYDDPQSCFLIGTVLLLVKLMIQIATKGAAS